jgi:hypothetical protein
MMKDHSKKVLPLVLFALIFISSNLFLYEDGLSSPVNKVCPQDITRIELVVQLKTPDIAQNYHNVTLSKSREKPSSFISKYLSDNKIKPSHFDCCQVIGNLMKWRLDFPANHIISIIQKTNCWHQSSDDEASYLILS